MGKVAHGLEIAEAEWKDKSKAVVMRAIGGMLDQLVSDEEKKATIMKMLMFTPERVKKMIMKVMLNNDDDSEPAAIEEMQRNGKSEPDN